MDLMFFAGLTFWGWALILLLIAALFPIVAYEQCEVGLFGIVLFFVAAYFLWHLNILRTIWTNPATTLIFIALYFLAGALWSVFRWWRYVTEKRKEFDEALAKFHKEYKIKDGDPIPDNVLSKWTYYKVEVPNVAKKKRSLVTWIIYWPWSMLWYFIRDFVVEIAEEIYKRLALMYTSIVNKQFEGVDKRLIDK